MYIINPGEFKHLIKIERLIKDENTDDDGFINRRWYELLTCRAKIVNTSGKEFQLNGGTSSSITSKFTIRANRKFSIQATDRILYNNNYYNILYPNDIMENNIYLEIVAEKVE